VAFDGDGFLFGPAIRSGRLAVALAQFSQQFQVGNFREHMAGLDAVSLTVFFQAVEKDPVLAFVMPIGADAPALGVGGETHGRIDLKRLVRRQT
jgi:hypothetical protein